MCHWGFPNEAMELKQKTIEKRDFFAIRIHNVPTSVPLSYDIYLLVNQKPVLFRKNGDTITGKRMDLLERHGGKEFLVPMEQREVFMNSLKEVMRNPEIETDTKSRVLKETAFIHVHDLFTKKNIRPAIEESKNLVEEMVSFVSSDISAVTSLMNLSVHDYYTYNHCVDVAVYSIALAKRILGNDKKTLFVAGLGGLLHDIGKRKIDYNIINKSKPLTAEEWEEIKRHPQYGKEYLSELVIIPTDAKRVVFEHHENFDGTGYPNGVKEDAISKLSRVVTIADVFDAITTNRSYHKALPPEEALKLMFSMQPGKFDPSIFKSFNKNFGKKGKFELPEDFDPCQGVLKRK